MEERNYGIDLLRIFSMFLIVILHILRHGGVEAALTPGSIDAHIMQLLKAAGYCAVNCFAIITGYVMCNAKPRISKALQLWLQTAFYTVGITVLFFFLFSKDLGLKDGLNALLPVSRGQYWFITAYFGMYLLSPFLNLAVQNMEKKTYGGLLAIFFVAFSLVPTALTSGMFNLGGGYSTIWLCLMYLVGGYMKRFALVEKVKSSRMLLCYGICVGLTFLSKTVLARLGDAVLGRPLPQDMLYQYISPTVVLAAVFLVLAFAKLSVKGWAQKMVAYFAPAALGVYLIHDNSFVREQLWKGVGQQIAGQTTLMMVLSILGTALGIVLACLLIDRVRIYLFQFVRIPQLCQKVDSGISRFWDKFNKE